MRDSPAAQEIPKRTQSRRQRAMTIQRFYDRGVPLFTKEKLADLAKQVDLYKVGALESNKIVTKGGNGREIRVELSDPPLLGIECEGLPCQEHRLTVRMGCWTIQDLTGIGRLFSIDDSYNAMEVYWTCVHSMGPASPKDTETERCLLEDDIGSTWRNTPPYRGLKALFESHPELGTARKVVGIDIGNMEYREPYAESNGVNKATFLKYNILLSIWELAKKARGADDVECILQEFDIPSTMTQILNKIGVKMVEHPHGFLEMDDNTILVSLYPEMPVRQVVADIARPIAILWHRSTVKSEKDNPRDCHDPSSVRVDTMIANEYDALYGFNHPILEESVTFFKRKNIPVAELSEEKK